MAVHDDPPRLNDAGAQRKWLELAPLIDRIMERVGTKEEFPVARRSSLAGDDLHSSPYQVSHAVRHCITAGVDHLHAAKVLIIDSSHLHVAAPFSLGRGALENLATAYWILRPDTRNERVERALRWHARNFRDAKNAQDSIGAEYPLSTKLAKLEEIATRRGLASNSVSHGYRSSDAVKYADTQESDLPLGVLLPWQLCSGFAHGRPWAYLGVSNLEVTPASTEDVVEVRLTSDHGHVLFPNLAAVNLLERLLRVYDQRAACHL